MDLPHRVEIVPWGNPKVTTTGSLRQQSSSQLGGGNGGFATASGQYTTFEVLLDSGTWTLTVIYIRGTNGGQTEITLGGASVGNVEHYNNNSLLNQVIEFSGISIASPGWYDLTITCTGKHASSSNYFCQYHFLTLRRTGA